MRAPPAVQTPVQPLLRSPGRSKRREGADERLFQVAQIDVQVALVVAQEKDRVADQLSGAVVGDVAAPLDLEDRDPVGGQQVLFVRAAAGGDDVGVLDEQQSVGDLVLLARAHQLALLRPDLPELTGAEV